MTDANVDKFLPRRELFIKLVLVFSGARGGHGSQRGSVSGRSRMLMPG